MSGHQRILNNRMASHQVGVSANGMNIFIELMRPPTSEVIAHNPHILNLIKEVASTATFSGESIMREYDMQRTVGYLDYAPTKAEDTVFYAKQVRSDVYTRFVKNRKTDATSKIAIYAERIDEDSYLITSVWIGTLPVPFPGEANASAISNEFWSSHAIVYNGQPLIASSITKEWPY